MRARTLCLLAVALTLGARGLAGDAAKTERAKFEGAWKVVSLTKEGKEDKVPAAARMIFQGNKFMMKGGGEDYEGTYTLDPKAAPKRLDTRVTHSKEKIVSTEGIYELEGDTLKIAWTEDTGKRPTAFVSKAGTGVRTITLKRAGR